MTSFTQSLLRAHQGGGTALVGVSDDFLEANAYAVHESLAAKLGPVGGFKTGRLSSGDAFVAPIFQRGIYDDAAQVGRNNPIGLELEIGFELLHPLNLEPGSDIMTDLARLFRPVPVIELVASRLPPGTRDNPIAKLADLQSNDGLVVGQAVMDWDGSDFSDADVQLTADETLICEGIVDVPGSSAIATLTAFLDKVGSHSGGLMPGHIVITGSLSPLTFVDAPAVVHGHIAGLGQVRFALV